MKGKASIIESLSVILAILAVIGGIVLAITLESFWYLIPSMLVAWLDYILLSSYADLLNTTADTNEMVKTLMEGQSDSQKKENQFTARRSSLQSAQRLFVNTRQMSPSIYPRRMADSIELFTSKHSHLAWNFCVNNSSCANASHYELYIRCSAADDKKRGAGTTHVFIGERNGVRRILGFITLRTSSFITEDRGQLKGSPALEVLELAVDKDFEGQGIGSELMKFAFATAVTINEDSAGVQYIVLCADHQASSFYRDKFGFEPVENLGQIPRDGWNIECIPMYIRLPENL